MSEADTIVKHISFPCDGLTLQGYLHLPAIKRPPVVIGSHGLYSSSSSPKQIALAHRCNHLGIAYFRFDHRGCGNSSGEFEDVTSLKARCRDLIAAVSVIRNRADTGNSVGLFGSSMGGTVCLMSAGKIGVRAMVTFAAPIRSRIPGEKPEITNQQGQGIYFDVARSRFDITDRLLEIDCILVIHGDADDVVPVSHAEELYKLVKEPKRKIIQKFGDHPMSNPEHQQTFIKDASMWFKQYLK